jgi:hypothetical protein
MYILPYNQQIQDFSFDLGILIGWLAVNNPPCRYHHVPLLSLSYTMQPRHNLKMLKSIRCMQKIVLKILFHRFWNFHFYFLLISITLLR